MTCRAPRSLAECGRPATPCVLVPMSRARNSNASCREIVVCRIAAGLAESAGQQRVDFSPNGNDKCVMIDDKIRCAPIPKAPIRVASTESN